MDKSLRGKVAIVGVADTEVGVRIRDKVVPGVVVRLPFYTQGSARR